MFDISDIFNCEPKFKVGDYVWVTTYCVIGQILDIAVDGPPWYDVKIHVKLLKPKLNSEHDPNGMRLTEVTVSSNVVVMATKEEVIMESL